MTNRVTESIRRGLEEAVAYVEGAADLSLYNVQIPENSAMKAIRTKTRKAGVRRPGPGPLESPPGDKP